MTRFLLVAVGLAACGQDHAPTASAGTAQPGNAAPPAVASAAPPVDAPGQGPCEPVPFAASSPVPEASGAAWLTIDGALALVVISDSGNHGAYAILDPDTGETREQGSLPLGGPGEDLEGLAARGDRLYGVTSAGWMRAWKRGAGGFELVDGPYPLGPIDLPNTRGIGDKPPAGTGMVCAQRGTNCGRNYEGLCLVDAAHARGPCAGFVAAKADGYLYCLLERDGRFTASYPRRIAIARPGVLADCAFGDDGSLWAGSNLFDLAMVYRIDGWEEPASATVHQVAPLGLGFPETLAVRGDVIYRMSDTGGAPSLLYKFRCPR